MVNGSRRFDGLTVLFHAFLRGLDAVGIPHSVYTCVDPTDRSEYPNDGRTVEGWRIPGGGNLEMGVNRLLPVFARRLRSVPEDLIHVNDAYLARLARYRPNVVVTLIDLGKLTTGWYPRSASFIHNLNLRFLGHALGVICATEHVRQQIIGVLGLPEGMVRVVPVHSLLTPGEPRPSPLPPSAKLPWNLLCVTTDRPHKNVRFFLELLRAAGDSYQGTIVGRLREETIRLVRSLGLQDRLTIQNSPEDMRPIYQAAHVLIFPSRFEGFGIPLVEAMSQGVPVLATRASAIPEVVGDGGILAEDGNLVAWLAALRRLSDPQFYCDQSRKAFRRSQDFSATRTGEALREAYDAFLANARRRGAG